MKVELVNDTLPVSSLGEGPSWDAAGKKLYWVDIIGRTIHRYDPATRVYDACKTPSTVGFVAAANDGNLVAGLQDGLYRVDFQTGSARVLVQPQYADFSNRFNEGKCDRRGRLWAGTMNDIDHRKPSGAFYRLDERGLYEAATGIMVSNGIGWSPDNKTMYYTDTGKAMIWAYDYDIETGTASNRRDFIHFAGPGKPDGMCVDSEGRLLVCLWDGAAVEIYTPDGNKNMEIPLPVPRVTCCAFGGDDLRTLYITTAATGLDDAALKKAPMSGRLFAANMSVPGLPETPFCG